MKASREIRLQQYSQAEECSGKTGCPLGNDPLAVVELRAHAHDALYPHPDRDRRSLICFAPEALRNNNVCAVRVLPTCRFAAHVISSVRDPTRWVCLMAYNEHMRLAIPECPPSVGELVRSPQSVARPVGWKSLLELGPCEATIATKRLSRCPHCQTQGVRLPLGIEGAIVGGQLC